MRRTKEEAEQTRQALLDAALKVFSQQGYEATRLEDVATAARVTRGAIYHHFGGKVDLYQALVEEASTQGAQVIQQAIQEGGTFLEIGQRVLVYTLKLLDQDLRFRQEMALFLFQIGGSPELAPFRQQRVEQGRRRVDEIAGFFRMGISQGAVRASLNAVVAARAFLAYQNGLILMWLSDPGGFSIDEEAEALAEVFIYGIAHQ
jgi:TetR/AcrR family transcriptional regulator, acrAB operon repressor